MRYWFAYIFILFIFGFSSCEKPQDYSPIPHIDFIKADLSENFDTLGNAINRIEIHFNFVDGDGDLGLEPSDTLGDFGPGKEYYYNLKFFFYEKQNGELSLNETINANFRFQNISKTQTTNKVLKGEMIVKIDLSQTINFADSSKFKFYIYDRALNKSNIEETNELFINQ